MSNNDFDVFRAMPKNHQYAYHLLLIKLWEMEAAIEKWNTQILIHGPEETVCSFVNDAQGKKEQLLKALKTLWYE